MGRKQRSFVVVGLGALGSVVATELARFGNRVLGIDLDERPVNQYANVLTATAVLDTTDEGALREIGCDRYDVALVAIGEDIQANILTTMNMRMLGIETIWAKAANRTHHRILSKLGADRVILPEQEMGRHAAQMLNNPAVHDYVSLGNSYNVVNLMVTRQLAGKPFSALGIEKDPSLRYLGMMRGTEFIGSAAPDMPLAEDDRLLLLGRRADLTRFGETL